jgi:hypothetical protein
VAGGWIRLHNEELHNLYTSPYIISVIKSRRVRWAGNVALTGDIRNADIILVGNLKEREHSEDISIDENIILEWI